MGDVANIGYVKATSSLIPGFAALLAWILIKLGDIADYGESDIVLGKGNAKEKPCLKEIELVEK